MMDRLSLASEIKLSGAFLLAMRGNSAKRKKDRLEEEYYRLSEDIFSFRPRKKSGGLSQLRVPIIDHLFYKAAHSNYVIKV